MSRFLVIEVRDESAAAAILDLHQQRKLIMETEMGEEEWKQLRALQARWRGDGGRFADQLEKTAKALRGMLDAPAGDQKDPPGQGRLFTCS